MNNGDLISREAALREICLDCHMKGKYPEHGCPDPCYEYGGISNLPAVDVVELPCKIGDAVWCVRSFHGHQHPQMGVVSEMLFTKEMKLQITVKYVGRGQWGEKIFPTYEEAEAAIKEKKHE